ncbi:reverse transcriptase domain-containing protein [Tanacetum coccineum]
MDNPYITMEEYVQLEAEKALRRGQTFSWETATYGKFYCEDIDYLKDFETEFPAIVYKDALTSELEVSSEPTVSPHCDKKVDFDFKISFVEFHDEDYTFIYDKKSFSYKLISVNDVKLDSEDVNDEINISSEDIVIEPSNSVIDANVDAHSHEFDKNFETKHDIHHKSFTTKDFFIMIKVVIRKRFYEGMPLIFIIKNLYVSFGILFDPKWFYKDGVYTNSCEGQGIDKFVFLVDFVILDMPEDIKVPLILGRPFLSTAHAKIDVFKRKFCLKVGDDKITFKSNKPTSNIIKRVFTLGPRERMELDLEARLMVEALILKRSLDPTYGDYIELNDLNEPLKLRRNQVEDLGTTIEEGEVIDEPIEDIVETRNDDNEISNGIDEYPSFYDFDKKIHINYAYNLQFSCMIVMENIDAYRDEGMGEVIVGKPFCRKVCVKARRFDGMITIYNGNDRLTYQNAITSKVTHLTNEQSNKMRPLLKVSIRRLKNEWDPPRRWGLSLGKESLTKLSQRVFPSDMSLGYLFPATYAFTTHILAHKRNMEDHTEQIPGEFSVLIL